MRWSAWRADPTFSIGADGRGWARRRISASQEGGGIHACCSPAHHPCARTHAVPQMVKSRVNLASTERESSSEFSTRCPDRHEAMLLYPLHPVACSGSPRFDLLAW